MVQAWLASTSSTLPQAPAFGSRRPVDDARHARQHDRARAHRARLERHIDHRSRAAASRPPREPPRAARSSRRVRSDPGAARARCGPTRRPRRRGPRPRRSARHRVRGTLGLAQGQTHEVVVTWKEALAHRSRRGLCEQCCAREARQHIIIADSDHAPPSPPSMPPLRARAAQRRSPRLCRARWHAPAPRRARGVRAGRIRAQRDPRQVRPRHAARGHAPRRRAPPAAVDAVVARPAHQAAAPGARCERGLRASRACAVSRDVAWAVPDYVARAVGQLIPNDPGTGNAPGDWQQLQWNFVGPFGVNAPEAWANLAADGAPGGKGVIVAVLDTGVAYANRGPFRRSPDFCALRRSSRDTTSSRTIPTPTTATATARSSPGRSPRRPTTTMASPAWPTARASCPSACSTPRAKVKPRRSPKACASRSGTVRG